MVSLNESAFVMLHVEADDREADRFRRAFETVQSTGELVRFRDGIEAMQFILEHGAPRFLVTHLKQGKLTGMELIGWIRNNKCLRQIPIFVCADPGDPTAEQHVKVLGVNGCLKGPIKPRDVEGILLRGQILNDEVEASGLGKPFRQLMSRVFRRN